MRSRHDRDCEALVEGMSFPQFPSATRRMFNLGTRSARVGQECQALTDLFSGHSAPVFAAAQKLLSLTTSNFEHVNVACVENRSMRITFELVCTRHGDVPNANGY